MGYQRVLEHASSFDSIRADIVSEERPQEAAPTPTQSAPGEVKRAAIPYFHTLPLTSNVYWIRMRCSSIRTCEIRPNELRTRLKHSKAP